jgi:hypothetical protein
MAHQQAMDARVRFFTSAALRQHEEVAGEIVHWLPRWITVEYDGERPVLGTWTTANGRRRICWYAAQPTPELLLAHTERFDDEPFWIVDRSELGQGRVAVFECDSRGAVQAYRLWDFDRLDMPRSEEERTPDGELRVRRTYECVSDGMVCERTEAAYGNAPIVLPRPHAFPIPELAGEPFPCGRRLRGAGVDIEARIVESIEHNYHQARAFVVFQRGGTWCRGVATIATTKSGWCEEARLFLELGGPFVAPLVLAGRLEGKLSRGYPFFGVVEELPQGRPLRELIEEESVTAHDAIAIAVEVGETARRAHQRGHQLGGIRPELVYAQRVGSTLALTGVAHRGPAVIERTYAGEAVVWPPVPQCEWSSENDVQGLAQLVWYLTTGTHPFLAREDICWNESWGGDRHRRRQRQPWTGPATLGALLERVLFDEPGEVNLERLLAELRWLADRTV